MIVLVPQDSNVALYAQVCWLCFVLFMSLFVFRQDHGFDPPCGFHQLPVFVKYSVHLELLAQLRVPISEYVRHSAAWYKGYYPLRQRFPKFRSEFKWKGTFPFLLTRTFGITSGGGPHWYFGPNIPTEIRCPFLTNRFFALIREFGKRI